MSITCAIPRFAFGVNCIPLGSRHDSAPLQRSLHLETTPSLPSQPRNMMTKQTKTQKVKRGMHSNPLKSYPPEAQAALISPTNILCSKTDDGHETLIISNDCTNDKWEECMSNGLISKWFGFSASVDCIIPWLKASYGHQEVRIDKESTSTGLERISKEILNIVVKNFIDDMARVDRITEQNKNSTTSDPDSFPIEGNAKVENNKEF
ncbi:hypothetical protein SUGI_0025780 [Cryptomeria japonica]|nr:hypothetical protein SUGI_0025780 [Cryptomeria japonica]